MNTSEVRTFAEQLVREGTEKLQLGQRLLQHIVASQPVATAAPAKRKPGKLSSSGLARIRAAQRASWLKCPRDCGKKHRKSHAHLRHMPQPTVSETVIPSAAA